MRRHDTLVHAMWSLPACQSNAAERGKDRGGTVLACLPWGTLKVKIVMPQSLTPAANSVQAFLPKGVYARLCPGCNQWCDYQVTLVREHCQGPNAMLYTLPTGGFDPRKSPTFLAAAQAELSEEVCWLPTFYPAASMLAKDLEWRAIECKGKRGPQCCRVAAGFGIRLLLLRRER